MSENIYIRSFAHAQEQGETEQYRQSATQNRACAAAIDKAIVECNYEQYRYNLSDALESVTTDFGIDRVAFVVAGLIHSHDYDGRYSRVNKEWAQDFLGTVEEARQVVINTHPVVMDGFADKVRAAQLAREKENYLATAEMGSEQNYNQIDGIINNEQPRTNQGYAITDCETVGRKEIVLAESPTAPSPYATWERNLNNDEETGRQDFYWGHYFSDRDHAKADFKERVDDARADLVAMPPSIRSQLKENAAQLAKPTAEKEQKKDAPQR